MGERDLDPEAVDRSILVTRPGRPGDPVRKVARIDEAGDSDAIALLAGEIRREKTLAGDEVLVEGIDTRVDIGIGDDIDRLIDALESLRGDDNG